MAAQVILFPFMGPPLIGPPARILRRDYALICAGTKAQTDAQRPGALSQ